MADRDLEAHLDRLKVWWPRPESNQRHTDFQSAALPTELLGLRAMRASPAPFFEGADYKWKAVLRRGA